MLDSRKLATTVKSLAVALTATLALAVASTATAAEFRDPQTRLAVADGADGIVRVFDVRSGRRLARLEVAGPAFLTTAGDGRHVLATQGDANRVDAIDAGAWVVDHGDHFHHHGVRPTLLPFRLRVPRPVHVVPHGDQVAIFADGSGEAHVFGLRALRRRAGERIRLATGKPHHGVAVPDGERFLVTQAAADAEDGDLPNALTLRDTAGATLGSFGGCPELHGETAGDGWAAFACGDGVLLVPTDGNGAPTRLPYPTRASDEQRAWSLFGDHAERWLVGDFGERALVVFDRRAGQSRVVDVKGEIASFAVHAGSGAILVLTTDGRLRRIDPASGRQQGARRVVARRFTPSWDRPAPKLTVGGGFAAVSDPRRHRVSVVRVRGMRLVRALRAPGRPTSVAFAGVPE